MELFKRVPNLRVLACGGDGTVGWVLSILDQIGASSPPAVGVLPLGTGNDLARALGWGGGYTDEPIGKILSSIGESETILLDRWQLVVERNPDIQNDDDSGKAKENLPLNVVNNYFSLGVDAHIALEFHEARGKFNCPKIIPLSILFRKEKFERRKKEKKRRKKIVFISIFEKECKCFLMNVVWRT